MAAGPDVVAKPHNWDQAVIAAFFILLGMTVKNAAASANVGERTLERWRQSPFWGDALEEAADDRFLKHLHGEALRSVFVNLPTDGKLALQVLERLDPRFRQPARLAEIDLTGQVEHRHVHVYLPDNGRSMNKTGEIVVEPKGNGKALAKKNGAKDG